MSEVVLDASALMALLNSEPGASAVDEALDEASISAINLSEVVARMSDLGTPESDILDKLQELDLDVIPFDTEQAYQAGLLRSSTRSFGLSLGDRACLALARRLGVPALTADRLWSQLSIGIEVRLIR